MQGQQAGCGVKGAGGGVIDKAFNQFHPIHIRSDGAFGQAQHLGGRIDADERPLRIRLGHRSQFAAAAGAEDERPGVGRRALGEQQPGHLAQAVSIPARTVGPSA